MYIGALQQGSSHISVKRCCLLLLLWGSHVDRIDHDFHLIHPLQEVSLGKFCRALFRMFALQGHSELHTLWDKRSNVLKSGLHCGCILVGCISVYLLSFFWFKTDWFSLRKINMFLLMVHKGRWRLKILSGGCFTRNHSLSALQI